ncbi:MAG: glycoside hydrolase family 25 protein [Planctomycetota bacterium]
MRLIVILATLLTAATAFAQRTRGIDVSQFQGTMNWETAYDNDIRFAFVRSTRGGLSSATGQVFDTRFDENIAALGTLADAGKPIYHSAYHFARPDTIPNGASNADIANAAIAEATHFVNVAGYTMVPGNLRPVLDLEAGGDNLTRAELSFWANTFMDEVERQTGAEPLIYMNTNYAVNFIDGSLADRDLWIANWNQTSYGNPVTGNGGPPTGAIPDWAFWQYSADGNGMGATFGASSTDLDLNVANGDLAFVESFLIQPIPEPAGLGALMFGGLFLRRRR